MTSVESCATFAPKKPSGWRIAVEWDFVSFGYPSKRMIWTFASTSTVLDLVSEGWFPHLLSLRKAFFRRQTAVWQSGHSTFPRFVGKWQFGRYILLGEVVFGDKLPFDKPHIHDVDPTIWDFGLLTTDFIDTMRLALLRLVPLVLLLWSDDAGSTHISGTFDTSEFFRFLMKFGFQKTDQHRQRDTYGYIFGNITSKSNSTNLVTLAVLDRGHFLEFYGNRTIKNKNDACTLMFKTLNESSYNSKCNEDGQDYLRYESLGQLLRFALPHSLRHSISFKII